MVDFSTLTSTAGSTAEADPRKLFQHLVKPDGVNELYASQSDVLEKWYAQRPIQDRILKLPTGGGKSLVGLLIAQSSVNETKLPAVYLAPTRQLVQQVCDEAARFGIPAAPYLSAKEGIPSEFLDSKAICVATYDAIFNGKSKFGTTTKWSEVPQLSALILDDAHAAFESVWKNFTFQIKSKEHQGLYNDLCSRFRTAFKQIGRLRTFDDVIIGREYYIMEVPYWEWLERLDEVGQAIQAYNPDKIDQFSWQHVRDDFHACHALISKDAFTIVPIVPFVERSTVFSRAKRRVFMSATIADDSEVVRTFGAPAKHVAEPLIAASLAGVGERMILAPSLMQLPAMVKEHALVESLVSDVRTKSRNAVILTPSFKAGEEWAGVAVVPKTGDESVALIEQLHNERGMAAVLPRRYDGVDLPGEDCRLLVLDGLPYGESDYDSWRISTLSQGVANSILAQRIEQAIGRGSRGTSDYCVVILAGADLVAWTGRTANQQFLSTGTKKQLEIGLTVSKEVKSSTDFIATAWQCLGRDGGWRSYHANEMASAAQPPAADIQALEMWEAERKGVEELRIRRFTPALNAFDVAIDKATDGATKGWFHQLKARVAFQATNATDSEEWQAKAYRLNMRLTAPRGQIAVVKMDRAHQQAQLFSHRLSEYVHPGVALSVYDDNAAYLTDYVSSNQFEEALERLFDWLGFAASRPDSLFKEGPDVLARAHEGPALVIEAKSRKKQKNKFTKTLHGQVLSHENWFVTNYGPNEERKRVVVYPTTAAEPNAGTTGTGVMTFEVLEKIVTDGRKLLKGCSALPEDQRAATAAKLISDLGSQLKE